jgi:hypothetical protein
MFKTIIDFFRKLFTAPTMFEGLEAHIIAGNPQNAADIEQLERGFYNRYQRNLYWGSQQ